MPTLTVEDRDENERLTFEQAIADVRELRQRAVDAPAGTVLDACENLAAALHGRIASAEQKGGTHGFAPRRTPDAPKARIDELS